MRATSESRAETPGRPAAITGTSSSFCGSSVTPVTLTDHAPSFVFSVPPETSRYHAASESATSVAVRPRAASASGRGLTRISGSRSPVAKTTSTPLRRSRSVLMRRPAARSVSSSAWPSSSSEAVGKPFEVVISRMRGSFASFGSSPLCLFCTSRRRSFMRLSKVRSSISRKRTSIVATFSRAFEITKRTSATPLMPSSSGLTIRRSTSSAVAPGNAAVMLTQLKLISGSCSRGIVT